MSDVASANEAQVEYWNAAAGPVWVENQARLDRQLAPLRRAAQAAFAPRAGERLLDVGCGCGETTLALAQAVGASGAVTGADISAPMLEVARRRAADAANVTFLQCDAQTADLGTGVFDGVFSRFGVMFFADPAAAFGNLAHATREGGRLAFVCWRALAENLWMRGPAEAAAPFLPPMAPSDPTAPGPFAFADPDRLRGLLGAGGWRQIELEPHDEAIGVGGVDETLGLILKVGPLGAALGEAPDRVPSVIDAVREFLQRHDGPQGVRLPAAVWIVTASRR
jgi:SAM-dependent methyltransferase